jgi:hypothetical protein
MPMVLPLVKGKDLLLWIFVSESCCQLCLVPGDQIGGKSSPVNVAGKVGGMTLRINFPLTLFDPCSCPSAWHIYNEQKSLLSHRIGSTIIKAI